MYIITIWDISIFLLVIRGNDAWLRIHHASLKESLWGSMSFCHTTRRWMTSARNHLTEQHYLQQSFYLGFGDKAKWNRPLAYSPCVPIVRRHYLPIKSRFLCCYDDNRDCCFRTVHVASVFWALSMFFGFLSFDVDVDPLVLSMPCKVCQLGAKHKLQGSVWSILEKLPKCYSAMGFSSHQHETIKT